MKNKIVFTFLLIVILSVVSAGVVYASGQSEIAKVRAATAQFQNPEVAQEMGWGLVPGLDNCFDNPGVGGMGFHYINTALLDTAIDPEMPEAMVYAPGPEGKLMLASVEYIVPAAAWDEAEPDALPDLFGHTFELNDALGVYVLHLWLWKHNPAGMFEDWNPQVSCP